MGADRVREYALLGITVVALSAATAVQYFVIYLDVIVPAAKGPLAPAPWMWVALFVPELLVCFVAGWRLRGPVAIATYAVVAAFHRSAWSWALTHADPSVWPRPAMSPGLGLLTGAIVYLAIFWAASASARTPGFVPRCG